MPGSPVRCWSSNATDADKSRTDCVRALANEDDLRALHEIFYAGDVAIGKHTPLQTEIQAEHDVGPMDDTIHIVADIRDKRFNWLATRATARITKPSITVDATQVHDAE